MSVSFNQFCPVCSSEHLRQKPLYDIKIRLMFCRSCSFVFMHRIPDAEELNLYYSKYSYIKEAYLSPITIKSYQKLLDEFETYRQTGNLLDVGCGRGWFLEIAKQRGWNVFGTEYSETSIRLCRNKGIDMKEGVLNAQDFDNLQFDVITSFEVIEHLSDPAAHVREIQKLLRQGGLFYCTTPNFNALQRYIRKSNYSIITYPEHLSYFTKSTLCLLAKKHDLKKLKFRSTGISLSVKKKSGSKTSVCCNSPEHPDEKFRSRIEKRIVLKLLKRFVNRLLTLTNTGITLKGYFVKQ